MTYLLDVNALLAFRYAKHMHYTSVRHWLERQEVNERGALRLATCAITELGFVRVATGPACLVPQIEHKHTTDGHLLQLAAAWGARLATLDTGIPGALLIPELPNDVSGVREPRPAYSAAA